jgi:hypothetical protein
LSRIAIEALSPYYDATLEGRAAAAEAAWEREAQEIIDAAVDDDELADITNTAAGIEVEAQEFIAELDERIDGLNDRVEAMVEDVELPPPPDLPEADLGASPEGSVLVSSAWEWVEQTRRLKAQKSYGNGGEDAP